MNHVFHARARAIRWGCELEVFGRAIELGQLIHADKHGFMAIPREDENSLLDAARFMDSNECKTVIAAARNASGKTADEALRDMDAAGQAFSAAAWE